MVYDVQYKREQGKGGGRKRCHATLFIVYIKGTSPFFEKFNENMRNLQGMLNILNAVSLQQFA